MVQGQCEASESRTSEALQKMLSSIDKALKGQMHILAMKSLASLRSPPS